MRDDDGGGEERVGRVRGLATALAVLLLVALAGVTVRQVSRLGPLDGDSSGELDVQAATDDDTAAPALPPTTRGSWELLPGAPVEDRAEPLALDLGEEVFVWGGWTGEAAHPRPLGDGALYHPGRRRWSSRLATAPRDWQDGAVALWTGSEVLVLGGRHGVGRDPLAQAWRHDDGTWRELARPPSGDWAWSAAVWTGRDVVVYDRPGHAGWTGERVGVAYDPTRDAWRRLPALRPSHDGDIRAGAWIEDQVVLVVESAEDRRLVLQAVNPYAVGATRRARAAPVAGQWLAHAVAGSAGDRMFLAGKVAGGAQSFAVAMWWPSTGWTMLPDPPADLRTDGPVRVIETPHGLVLWPEGDVPPSMQITGVWRPLTRAPMDKRFGEAVVWADDGLFVWGGHDRAEQVYGSGALFRPEGPSSAAAPGLDPALPLWSGRWTELGRAPERLGDVDLLSDGDMLSIVGRVAGGPRQVWRQFAGTWGSLVQEAGDLPQSCAVPIDGRVLVWGRGGDPPAPAVWSGHLVDRDGQGGPLPPPPLPDHGTLLCTVWQEEAVVATGSGEGYAAAAFDLERGEWRRLSDPPVDGFPIAVLPLGGGPAAPLGVLTHRTLARLSPQGVWTTSDTPANSFVPYTQAVAWTGLQLLTWGGVTEEPLRGGWSWDSTRDRWRQIPPGPVGGTPDMPPHTWTGERWVVWGRRVDMAAPGALAAYDPAAGQWFRLPPPPSSSAPLDMVWHHDGLVLITPDGTVARFVPDP